MSVLSFRIASNNPRQRLPLSSVSRATSRLSGGEGPIPQRRSGRSIELFRLCRGGGSALQKPPCFFEAILGFHEGTGKLGKRGPWPCRSGGVHLFQLGCGPQVTFTGRLDQPLCPLVVWLKACLEFHLVQEMSHVCRTIVDAIALAGMGCHLCAPPSNPYQQSRHRTTQQGQAGYAPDQRLAGRLAGMRSDQPFDEVARAYGGPLCQCMLCLTDLFCEMCLVEARGPCSDAILAHDDHDILVISLQLLEEHLR